jgi:hypothetical protein
MAESALDVIDQEHRDLDGLFRDVADPRADRGAVLVELSKRAARHIAVERAILLPVVKKHGVGGDELVKALQHEYDEMERLLVLIERRKKTSPDLPDLLNELLDLTRSHQDRTEKALRPGLAKELSAAELEELGREMHSADAVIISHPHPHLLSLGPISRFTTRLVGRFDRGRDRTVTSR